MTWDYRLEDSNFEVGTIRHKREKGFLCLSNYYFNKLCYHGDLFRSLNSISYYSDILFESKYSRADQVNFF